MVRGGRGGGRDKDDDERDPPGHSKTYSGHFLRNPRGNAANKRRNEFLSNPGGNKVDD